MPVIIDQGGPSDSDSIPLATRARNWIRNVRRREARSDVLRSHIELTAQHHPAAELRSTTARYNCMALPFGSRRTWVAPDDLDPVLTLILRDDGYEQVANPADLRLGDLVVYRERSQERRVSHVGTVARLEPQVEEARVRIVVLSKWGQFGEYIHEVSDVPHWLGMPAEYWTDRRVA